CRLEIVNSYARVREIIAENEANNEEFKIAVVITIEGGHALGCGHVVQKTNSNRNDSNTPANVDEAKLLERVNALKGVGSAGTPAWEPTPLWITLAHAFGNNIIGNAQALPKFYKPKLRFFEPHWKGTESGDTIPEYELTLNKGMTPTGEKIIKRLLGIDGNNQGRRILIDIKHMSIRSRLKYYEILDVNKAQYPDDNIPIILSHGGVNGEPSITTAGKDPTDSHEDWLRRDRREKFNPWSFGLHDDEIIRIHRSQGLIGLIVDQRVLACRKRVPPIRSKLWSSRKWARLVTDQILHIVKTVYAEGLSDKADIWNMICIGTDFDGGINPMDKYKTATRFKELFENVESLLGESKFESYRDGVDAHALTVNIFSKNALDFLKKHY
ncbi:MAG: hypothetical protein IIA45_04430, partial [Bacteroidetes bacterium]|nr:hypothetical protein [Bacteroidota bacterium]